MSIYFVSITHASSKVTVVPILFLHASNGERNGFLLYITSESPRLKNNP